MAAQLAASQEGLSSMELIRIRWIYNYYLFIYLLLKEIRRNIKIRENLCLLRVFSFRSNYNYYLLVNKIMSNPWVTGHFMKTFSSSVRQI
jgi:hypothetical protein